MINHRNQSSRWTLIKGAVKEVLSCFEGMRVCRAESRWLSSVLYLLSAVLWLSSSAMAGSNEDCLACHSDRTLSITKNGKHVSLFVRESRLEGTPHGQLDCTACHTGLDMNKIPHAPKIRAVDCVGCHGDVTDRHAVHKSLLPPSGDTLAQSNECKKCHGSHMSKPLSESCGTCHPDAKAGFARSAHGKALISNVPGAPSCLACHAKDIVSGREGQSVAELKRAQQKVCLSCHVDNPKVVKRTGPKKGFIVSYEKSVHARALAKGNGEAANCVDCHGSHEIEKGISPDASVNKAQVSFTCGKCHEDIMNQYADSVHGKAAARGVVESPVCTTCHGEHKILKHSDPESPVSAGNVSQQVCGSCHSSVALSEKYGISSDRFQTFSDSYHGLAIRGGSVKAANCASCHGSHNIKPSSDPTSTINRANIPKTCGKCHPGANKRFAVGKVHVAMASPKAPVLYIIGIAYTLLIIGTIGGMLFHNALDMFRKWRGHVKAHDLHGLYVRMTVSERVQHLLMMASFFVLAITGFMLHYPDAWWVKGIRSLSPDVFDLRSLLHRVAAVVMVAACVIHVVYILFTERGRQLFRDMLPRRQDVFDAVGAIKYGLGLTKDKPKIGRFGYIEKSEYWALVWGTVVMTATGVIMWMENTFIKLLTKLGWDIARTVHFYEAWLAVLAIIVWHLYFVIFNPDVYPMNAAWLTGTLPEDVLAKEHPLEYEKLRSEISAKKHGRSVESEKGEE